MNKDDLKMPKISIIMPVYNAEKYIYGTIQSIVRQTYSDFELILIDDCGKDKSLDIADRIKDKRIKVVHNSKNKGIAYSRNIGLKYATGQYIALMDNDDLCPLDRLQKQNDYLDMNMQYDVVGGRYEIINEENKRIKLLPEPLQNSQYIKAHVMFYDPIANGSAMFRSDFISKNQIEYQENCLGMEDYRFWVDCSLKGNITNIPDVLLSWRLTASNETSRCMLNETTNRSKKFAEIQQYALTKNGFKFQIEDIRFINKMFPENIKSNVAGAEDLVHLYELFRDMINQAHLLELRNKQEIRTCCKKMFSMRMENSCIWQNSMF